MTDQGQRVDSKDRSWFYWFTVPIYPYSQRRTLRTEVVKDTVWTFDQLQGIFYVVTPIRMTVIKLKEGGLLVYAPVAPTRECVRLMQELVAQQGEVKYIILPTVSGLEHKVFVGPFARKFPSAQVFVLPNLWSYPINLPMSWLGLPTKRSQVLPQDWRNAPFADEFEYEILEPIALGIGPFAEVAFFHPRSQTLLVTDAVVSVPTEPPAIVQLDPYPLLYHAKDSVTDGVSDTPENRRKGWQRVALFTFYFRPSALDIIDFLPSVRDALKAPDRSRKALFGWFPFHWKNGWQRSFEALQSNKLIVAPILQTLILNRAPKAVIDWANRVANWKFERVISCHLEAPIEATPQEFRQAFAFLEKQPAIGSRFLPDEDFQLLYEIEAGLNQRGVTPPRKERV
jgi:hypothetical protein